MLVYTERLKPQVKHGNPLNMFVGPEPGNISEKDKAVVDQIAKIWQAILSIESVKPDTDFFASGAGSMDVTRLLSNINKILKVDIPADDVFMNPMFNAFCQGVISKLEGGGGSTKQVVPTIDLEIHGVKVQMPYHAFINGQFVPAKSGKTHDIVNPTTEKVFCKVCEEFSKIIPVRSQAVKNPKSMTQLQLPRVPLTQNLHGEK